MSQSISFELKETAQGQPYTAVTLEHSISSHTHISVVTNVPNDFGTDSLNEIQARLWESTCEQIAEHVKRLRG